MMDDYIDLLLAGEAYTLLYRGKIILCGGIFPMTDWIARGWVIMAHDVKPSIILATRDILSFLHECDYDRVETPVRRGFANGHRWVSLMGFTNETPEQGMKYYGFDGDTYDLYAIYPKELRHGETKSI